MDADRYLASIENDAAVIATVANRIPMDTPVPSCPGWTFRDLLVHTGVVHRHKTAIVREGLVDRPAAQPQEPASDEVSWFADGVEGMLAAFRAADLTAPTWTWCTHDHAADWWVRRMAHETAIHAADALLAADEQPVIDDWLGLDGVDEILDEMMVGVPSWAVFTPENKVVSLVSRSRQWVLRFGTFSGTSPLSGRTYDSLGTLVYEQGASPTTTIRAEPGVLDLWIWGRGPLPADAVHGDASVAAKLRSIAAEATQ